jgi:hypothetical protein
MDYDHKKRSFCDAVKKDKDQLNKITRKAEELMKLIEGKDGARSETVEAIDKKIKNMTKKEEALLIFFLSEMYNHKAYKLIGIVLGRIIGESMIAAGELNVPVAMKVPMNEGGMECLFDQIVKKKKETKKEEEDDDEKGMSYVQ